MSNSFQRVNRTLRADKAWRSTLVLGTALLLLAGWLIWAFHSHITRYEVSDSARLEVASATYAVQTAVSGKLISYSLTLGKQVHAGDVLAEIESNSERLSLEGERTRLAAIGPELGALHAQTQTEQDGGEKERRVLAVSVASASAQYREAQARADLADQEAERAGRMRAEGILSEADAQRVQADAQSKRAAAESLKSAMSKLEPELEVREKDREVRLKQIDEEIAELGADRAATLAAIERLKYEIERHRIRAAVSGRLGECAPLHSGSRISEGQQLGVIIPSGELQIIAEFQPSAALGKVRSGQRAILRLQGFPWAQYGALSARVSRVAGEIREGKVRVELAVNSAPPTRIPVQHGLPGSVEVETERVTPAALFLRSAGALMDRP